MRILQISDTHLGAELNARGPAGWSRALDHHRAMELALEPALRGEVDLVLHTGDVFDRSRPPVRWVVAAGELLQRVAQRVPVIGIAGNHDRRGIQRWLPHRQLVFTDVPMTYDHLGVRLGLVPFRRNPERFADDVRSLGTVDLLAVHQGPAGCQVGPFTFRPGETIDARHLNGAAWVACGHIHPRQRVQLDGSTVICAGSTERTSFAEATETKGSVRWAFGAGVTWSFVDHPVRRMDAGPGALIRCSVDEADAVCARGQIAVITRDTPPHARLPRADPGSLRLPLFGGDPA